MGDATATDSDAAGDPAPWAASVAELRGRYVVLDRLGEGGMGIVHRAYDPALRREVALKVLRTSGPVARDRMLREAQALARVTHPHVVTVYDVGTAGDDVFIAMELVRGATLGAWLRGGTRTPPQILDVCLAAGAGLAAAHAAGLVHRDFKPSNVMVGDDGRVRVLDFGLARPTGTLTSEPSTPSPDSPDLLATPITRHGAVVGTPRYMAPEQRSGGGADARSDQYALCLVIEEALSGRDPSEATTENGHGTARTTRPVLPLPRRARAAIARGLDPDPAARFETIDELVDEVAPRRRGVQVAIVAAIAIVLGGGVVAFVARPGAVTPCSAISRPFDQMWSVPIRETMHAAFVAAAGEFGQETWARVVSSVETWGHEWVDLRHHTCEATHVRGEQSAELMDRRMACLEDRRRELGAVLASFGAADRDIVIASLPTLHALEPVAHCADSAALLGIEPVPFGNAAAIDSLKHEVDQIAAITHAKKTADTVERAQKAADLASKLGYAPVEAQAYYQLAQAQVNAQRWEPASKSFEASALAADRARDDRLRAKAWIEDVYVVSWGLRQGDAALHTTTLARAALARVTDPATMPSDLARYTADAYSTLAKPLEALRLDNDAVALLPANADRVSRANVLGSRGLTSIDLRRFDEALVDLRAALGLYEAEYGPDHPVVAGMLSNIANVLVLHVSYAEGEKLLYRALAIGERAYGPDHPQTAVYLNNIVNSLVRQERFAEALPLARRAVAIREAKLPPDHPFTIRATINLAVILTGLGQHDQAEQLFAKGLAMQARTMPPEHTDIAYAKQLHANSLMELGRPAEARDELVASAAIYHQAKLEDSALMSDALAARAMAEAGEPVPALALADKTLARAIAIKQDYDEPLARWARAAALVALGKRDEARTEVDHATTMLGSSKDPDGALLANQIAAWRRREKL